MEELKELLTFRKELARKGQLLSKPKYERLTQLLTQQLDAENLDGYEDIL